MATRGWPKGKHREVSAEHLAKAHAGAQTAEARAKQRAYCQSPDGREHASKAAKALWNDPERRAQLSAKRKALWQDPAYREKVLARSAEAQAVDAVKAKRLAASRKGADAVRGKPQSPEHRAKRMAALRAYLDGLTPEERQQRASRAAQAAAAVAHASNIERAVQAVLDTLGVSYVAQKSIAYWIVDFYLPQHRLVVECDGDYWHSRPEAIEKDARKDHWLRAHKLDIARLTERAILRDAYGCVVAALTAKGILRDGTLFNDGQSLCGQPPPAASA